MSPGLLKALIQAVNHYRNWRKADPERATEHGRSSLFWVLIGGITVLWILYQQGIANPQDIAFYTGGLFLVDILQYGTVIRIGATIDPFVGGVFGTIGLGALAKLVRDIGGLSAAINYFRSIW